MTCAFANLARSIARNDGGSVGPLFALAAIPAFMVIGMSIDYRRATATQTEMQVALDSAVVAARNQTGAQQITTAKGYFDANYRGTYAPATPLFDNSSGLLQGKVSSKVPTTLTALMHINSIAVDVIAAATPDSSTVTGTAGGTPCIMVLDPNKFKAMNMISNSNLQAPNCEVHVRSSNGTAFYSESASQVVFKKILVKGGATGGSQIKDPSGVTAVVANAPNVADDPFASKIPSVTVGACTDANTNKSYSGSVNPGTFCGNTTFSGTTMAPGLYIVSGGRLTISGKTTGNGVAIYFADNAATLNYGAAEGSTLTAPTTGTYRGLLMFMQPRASTSTATVTITINSENKQSWTGLVYLPNWDLSLVSDSSWPKMNVALVVNSLYANSLSTVIDPYEWTPWNSTMPVKLPGDQTVTLTAGRITQ